MTKIYLVVSMLTVLLCLSCKGKEAIEIVPEDVSEDLPGGETVVADVPVPPDVVAVDAVWDVADGEAPDDSVDVAEVSPDVAGDAEVEAFPDVAGDAEVQQLDALSEVKDQLVEPDAIDDLAAEVDICSPDCEGKECGPDGCGSLCGMCYPGCVCSPEGICLGCGPDEFEEIVPTCVHVPFLVGAGGKFPIAVFAETVTCGKFDHVLVNVFDGYKMKVELWAKKMEEPCPPCIFNYWGIVWIDPVLPGPYQVQVSSLPPQYMVASGGDLPEPACDDDCAPELGDEWTLTCLESPDSISVGCGDYQNKSAPVSFSGDCQEYEVGCAEWTGPTELRLCTETDLFFDIQDPVYSTTATRCEGPWGYPDELILGLTLTEDGSEAEMFIFEK